MARKPILLFLHGVGEGDPDDTWMQSLSTSCQTSAIQTWAKPSRRTQVPQHLALAIGRQGIPTKGHHQVALWCAAKQNRREFERRIGALEVCSDDTTAEADGSAVGRSSIWRPSAEIQTGPSVQQR